MKLTELSPKWLKIKDRIVGLVFLCPHCQATWVSCFFEKLPLFKDSDGERFSENTQFGLFQRIVEEDFEKANVIPCNPAAIWTKSSDTFENLTIMPSLDFSASGHWHGFIKNGEIV